MGQGPDSNPPTHPDISDLSHIRQEPQETIHHYWARFLLVMNKVKDYREEDAISFFCNNCTDKGILNAISCRNIAHFADLEAIVWKYCAMESAWKTETKFWDNPALAKHPIRIKREQPRKSPDSMAKGKSPLQGMETYWRDGLTDPAKFIAQRIQYQRTALEHVGYSGRWPKVVRIYSSQKPQSTIPGLTIRY